MASKIPIIRVKDETICSGGERVSQIPYKERIIRYRLVSNQKSIVVPPRSIFKTEPIKMSSDFMGGYSLLCFDQLGGLFHYICEEKEEGNVILIENKCFCVRNIIIRYVASMEPIKEPSITL